MYGAWTEGWGRTAVRSLITMHPDLNAILCGSNQIAHGVLDALRGAGRDVPSEISVIGHDNWEQIAIRSRPPQTTVDRNHEEVGRHAAHLLFDAIDGNVNRGIHAVATRAVSRESISPAWEGANAYLILTSRRRVTTLFAIDAPSSQTEDAHPDPPRADPQYRVRSGAAGVSVKTCRGT